MRKIDYTKLADCYEVRRLDRENVQEIYELMEDNPRFFEYSSGGCSPEQILRDMETLPPGKSAEDKYYLGYYERQYLIAVLDFIDGYPDSDTAYIGFFMLDKCEQGKKLGRALIEKLCLCCGEWGYRRVMLGWEKANPQSSRFWQSCGFEPIREVEQSHGTVVAAERFLPPKYVPDFDVYLIGEAARCPLMEPRDALKLCYQAAYGAEHGIKDPNSARKYLREELKRLEPDGDRPLSEGPISPELCRVDLRAWKARGLKWQWLYAMFEDAVGDGKMAEKLAAAERLAAEGKLPFTAREWREELAGWDGGAVSHSEAYRKAYSPAYRIVPMKYAACIPVLEKMAEQPEGCVVAIDGMSNSGKSSLAALLEKVTGAGLVRMDDLLSPASRMQVVNRGWPGGNVNYAMFREHILPHLHSAEAFSYPYFANHSLVINKKRRVRRSPYRIVEGSYCQHIVFGDYADIKVFMHTEKSTQYRRVVARDGVRLAPSYFAIWIPQEDEYFGFFDLKNKADIVIET